MRKVAMILLFLGLALIAINQWRLSQKLSSTELEWDAAQTQPAPSNDTDAKMNELNELQTKLDEATLEIRGTNQKLTNLLVKVSDLDPQIGERRNTNGSRADIVWAPNPQMPAKSWGAGAGHRRP
jgi:peptidoglycan hydrolase CwlO-like protein